eukprot:scaffold96276_cov52-Prasinocladus_malaysianus.AAC.1
MQFPVCNSQTNTAGCAPVSPAAMCVPFGENATHVRGLFDEAALRYFFCAFTFESYTTTMHPAQYATSGDPLGQ